MAYRICEILSIIAHDIVITVESQYFYAHTLSEHVFAMVFNFTLVLHKFKILTLFFYIHIHNSFPLANIYRYYDDKRIGKKIDLLLIIIIIITTPFIKPYV